MQTRHPLPMESERRRHMRIGFDCPVRWNIGGVDRVGWARDVSESGAGFLVRPINAPDPGEDIRLIFELDENHQWMVDDRAHVQRCESRPDGLVEVGVQLTPIRG